MGKGNPRGPAHGPTVFIHVHGIGRFAVSRGVNLREGLREGGLYLDGTCQDRGTCGRCRIGVLEGNAGDPTPSEVRLIGERDLRKGIRLACRVVPSADLRIQVEEERILDLDRTGLWKRSLGTPLLASLPCPDPPEGYGAAVDMGTTSMVACLYDMGACKPLGITASGNPQMPWGSEILSRLQRAAGEPEAAAAMRRLTWEKVGKMVRALCGRAGISTGSVSRVVAVANSAVHHLAAGLSPSPLLEPPYEPAARGWMTVSAVELEGLEGFTERTAVHLPPPVGGYAGGDALVSILAALRRGVGPGALIDVGSNTEIAAWSRGRVTVATAPAGSAFEGGAVQAGMRAEEGAVWSVDLDDSGARVSVIGDGPPRGICGTGLVDAVAEMLRLGLVDETGLMKRDGHPCLVEDGLSLAEGVRMTGADVAEIQKAKAAVAAALETVLSRLELPASELETVYLSGAFGSGLRVRSAVRVGLLPDLPADRFIQAGNAALAGAALVLLSGEAEREARALAQRIEHVNVAQEESFEDRFLEHLYFGSGAR